MTMDYMISQFANESMIGSTSTRRICGTDGMHNENNVVTLVKDVDKRTNCLPPEVEQGNVEYKVKLINPYSSRIQRLISQMKWRLREGQGEAIYEIGVEDCGNMVGLTDSELDASLKTLRTMASALGATTVTLSEHDVTPKCEGAVHRRVMEVLVRKVPDSQQFIEIRLAILGSVDAGKSTLCGVLTQGVCDDGNGKARLNLFRYLHEFQTGRTSSVCRDVIGFDSHGQLLNYGTCSLEEIAEKSTKLITLIDLAGDRKYLKTTIYGLTGYLPHFAAIVISALTGPTAVTREHLGFALVLNIPLFVVISKADTVTTSTIEKVTRNVISMFKRTGMNRRPRRIHGTDDLASCVSSMLTQSVVPIFVISNVTGHNMDLLKCFLNVLPPSGYSKLKVKELSMVNPHFTIEEVFRVPHVGVVVGGMLIDGVLSEGECIQIGPDRNGLYHFGKIGSIKRNKQSVRVIKPGQAASVAVYFHENDAFAGEGVKKGMVMLHAKDVSRAYRQFTARLYLLYHPSNEICIGFQATVYIGSVCQTATIIDISVPSIIPCQWIIARFEFYNKPEFLLRGTPLVFREGKTKGMGEVVDVFE